jgi:hypothetical protein
MRRSRIALLILALVLAIGVAGGTLAPAGAATCPYGQCTTDSECANFCCAVYLYCPPYPAGDGPICHRTSTSFCGRCYC